MSIMDKQQAPTQVTQRMPMQNRARYAEQEESEAITNVTYFELGLFTTCSINGSHNGEIHITPEVNGGVRHRWRLDTGG